MPRIIRRGRTYNRPTLGFDSIHFTVHALDRMKQRRITRDDIYRAIDNPDQDGLPTTTGRERVRWQKTERFSIDVVYEIVFDTIRIITTFRTDERGEKGKPPSLRSRRESQSPRQKRKQKRKGRRK